jgi:hypothetical protein
LQYLRWARLLPAELLNLQSTSSLTTTSFQLANLDCLLPGDPETKAITRMVIYSLVLPAALFMWAFLAILLVWALGRLSVTTRRWVSDPEYQTKSRVVQSLGRALNSFSLSVAKFAGTAPELPPLWRFVKRRMIVSAVVLSFTLYQPFTSNMLLILQCQHIARPTDRAEVKYEETHSAWLEKYNSTSVGLWGKEAPVWDKDV